MAFATSNVQRVNMGSIKAMAGDWSGTAGDASGTVSLSGGRVYLSNFSNQDATPSSPKEYPLVDVSVSSGSITLTVHNHQTVTNGRFLVIFA